MPMQDFEKLGGFYLGKRFNQKSGDTVNEPIIYDAKNLTTHAVCVGMTGSGKTGLGIGSLDRRRTVKCGEASLYTRWAATTLDHLHCPPVRCRTNVPRNSPSQRSDLLDAHTTGLANTPSTALYGRNLWVLPAHSESAVQDSNVDPAETGARVRVRSRSRNTEPG